MTDKNKGFFYAIAGSLLWGASGTVAQFFFENNAVATEWVVGIRLLTAGLLLLVWCLLSIPREVAGIFRSPADFLQVLLFGLLGVLPSQFTYFMAIRLGNAPTATILQFLSPLFILVYLSVRHARLPRRIDFLSIALALSGTYLLVTRGQWNQLALSPRALFWGVLAGVSAALYTLLPGKLLKRFDAKVVTGVAMVLSGSAFLPVLARTELPEMTRNSWFSLAFIVVGGTMFAYLFYIQSLKYIAPSTTSMLSAFEPMTATILSVVFLGTAFGIPEITGSLLIISVTFLQALPAKYPRLGERRGVDRMTD